MMRSCRIDHSGKGSSVGRASAFQADCREFEPRPLLHGPVAQWIRAAGFYPVGRKFESCRGHHCLVYFERREHGECQPLFLWHPWFFLCYFFSGYLALLIQTMTPRKKGPSKYSLIAQWWSARLLTDRFEVRILVRELGEKMMFLLLFCLLTVYVLVVSGLFWVTRGKH